MALASKKLSAYDVATGLLCQLSGGTPLNKFGLVGSPPGVSDTKHLFQHVQFQRTQVFFSFIAVSAYLLLFHITLFNGARPVPCKPLKREQILRQDSLQFFK